jgi:glycerol-3-phosphate acyltransferase PlsY
MHQLSKTLHVLAVGLWFGMAVFFSIPVALTLFGTFERVAEQDPRPVWFPLAQEFDRDPLNWQRYPSTSEYGPDHRIFRSAGALRREQGVRAAGAAIGSLFDWYFLLQSVCAVLAVATALQCTRAEPGLRAHRLRKQVLLLALLTVVVGWPLEHYVSSLRGPRDATTDDVLRSAPNIPEAVHADAVAARRAFGMWHGISTLLNLGTIALVTVAMALAARLPNSPSKIV